MSELTPCPFCGKEPLMYKWKKSGEVWVHCHNGSYKGVQGVECPIADHNFTVDEWNYRPHEVKLLKLLLDARDGTRQDWNVWLREIAELCGEDNTCPECGGVGEVSGAYFSDDGITTCDRCNGKGTV